MLLYVNLSYMYILHPYLHVRVLRGYSTIAFCFCLEHAVIKLDLLKKPSTTLNSEALQDMAKVGSVAVAHAHRHHPPNDNMTTSTPRGPEHSVNSKPPSRRGSRISNRAPQIVIEPPSREDELYPSLTTLGSFQDDEDEFSCKDCCRSGTTHVVCMFMVPGGSWVCIVYTSIHNGPVLYVQCPSTMNIAVTSNILQLCKCAW